jgi:hypothetical protein
MDANFRHAAYRSLYRHSLQTSPRSIPTRPPDSPGPQRRRAARSPWARRWHEHRQAASSWRAPAARCVSRRPPRVVPCCISQSRGAWCPAHRLCPAVQVLWCKLPRVVQLAATGWNTLGSGSAIIIRRNQHAMPRNQAQESEKNVSISNLQTQLQAFDHKQARPGRRGGRQDREGITRHFCCGYM